MFKERGVLTFIDQVDPGYYQDMLLEEEYEKWPGWSKNTGKKSQEYHERLQEEWQTASYVLVNSEWSKTALIKQNVSPNKIMVVPLAHEPKTILYSPKSNKNKCLKVIWLGTVSIIKGIQYLISAAK